MKILSIGSDRNIFKLDSNVRRRIIEYGNLFDEFRIIIFSLKTFKLLPQKVAENVWIYPTNSRNRLFYIFDAWKIGQSLKDKFEIVTAQDPFESGLVGWFLNLSTNSKFQLQVHTDFLSAGFKKTWLNFWRVLLAKFLLPRADRVRVVSQRIADSIKEKQIKLKTEPIILPIWIDIESLKKAQITTDLHQKYPEFKKIVLMVSRLEPEKQVDLAIKNLAEFLRAEKTVGLVIVGSGSLESALKNLTKKLRLENLVKFEGWQENIAPYYKTADLFLITSRFEGYGATIVEAVACGLPVVSTDVGVAKEMGATIIHDFSKLGELVEKYLSSPVKLEIKKDWPTKKEFLNSLRSSFQI